MPVQRTILGQPLALRLPPRRFQLLFVFVLLFIATIYAFGAPTSDSIPTYEEVKGAVEGAVKDPHLPHLSDVKEQIQKIPDKLSSLPKPKLPIPDVFSPPAHTPPAFRSGCRNAC